MTMTMMIMMIGNDTMTSVTELTGELLCASFPTTCKVMAPHLMRLPKSQARIATRRRDHHLFEDGTVYSRLVY